MNKKLIDRLFACDVVEALVLGGSRATGVYDEKSDYDYYVYLSKDFPESERKKVIEGFVLYMEYSNQFWELEDDGTLVDGVDIEFIYRNIKDMNESMENLLVKGNVSMGYSTCFVDNIIKSKVVFDKNGRYKALQDRCKKLLTDELFDKVIYSNFPLLMDQMPSLYYQIEKALRRNDILSINHRSTAYFEMYFDILFALNRETHPGEKRMLKSILKLDKYPKDMKQDIENYFIYLYSDSVKALNLLEKISLNLYDLLIELGYNVKINSYKNKN